MGGALSFSKTKTPPDPNTYNFSETINVIGTATDVRFICVLWMMRGLHSIQNLLNIAGCDEQLLERQNRIFSAQSNYHLSAPVYFTPQSVPLFAQQSNQHIVHASCYRTLALNNDLPQARLLPLFSDSCYIPPIVAFTTENYQMIFDQLQQSFIANYSPLSRTFGPNLVAVPVIENKTSHNIPSDLKLHPLQTHFSPEFAQNIVQDVTSQLFASINGSDYVQSDTNGNTETSGATALQHQFNTILTKHLDQVRSSLINQQYYAEFTLHTPVIYQPYIFSSSRIKPNLAASAPPRRRPMKKSMIWKAFEPVLILPRVSLQPLNQTLIQKQVFTAKEDIQPTKYITRPKNSLYTDSPFAKPPDNRAIVRAKSYNTKNGGKDCGLGNHNPYPLLYIVMLDFQDPVSVQIFQNFTSHLYSLYSTIIPTSHLKPINLFITMLNQTPLDEVTACLTTQDVHDLIDPLISHAADHNHHLSVEFHSFGAFPSINIMRKVFKFIGLDHQDTLATGPRKLTLQTIPPHFPIPEIRAMMQSQTGIVGEDYFNYSQRVLEFYKNNPTPSDDELRQKREELGSFQTPSFQPVPPLDSLGNDINATSQSQRWVFTDFYQRQVELVQHLDQYIGTTYLTKLGRDLDNYIAHFKHVVVAQVAAKLGESAENAQSNPKSFSKTTTTARSPPKTIPSHTLNTLIAPHLSPNLTPLQSQHILSANIHVYSPYHPKVSDYYFSSITSPTKLPFFKPVFPPPSLFKSFLTSQLTRGMVKEDLTSETQTFLQVLAIYLQLIPTFPPVHSTGQTQTALTIETDTTTSIALTDQSTQSSQQHPFQPIGSHFIQPRNIPVSLPVLLCLGPPVQILNDIIEKEKALHMIGTMIQFNQLDGSTNNPPPTFQHQQLPQLSGIFRFWLDSFNESHLDQCELSPGSESKQSTQQDYGDDLVSIPECLESMANSPTLPPNPSTQTNPPSPHYCQPPLRLVVNLPESFSPQIGQISAALDCPEPNSRETRSFQFTDDPNTIYTVSFPRLTVANNLNVHMYEPLFNTSPLVLSQLKSSLLPHLLAVHPHLLIVTDENCSIAESIFKNNVFDFEASPFHSNPTRDAFATRVIRQYYPLFANCTYLHPVQQQQQQQQFSDHITPDPKLDQARTPNTHQQPTHAFTTFPTFHFNQTFHNISSPELFNHDMPFSEVSNFTFLKQRTLDDTAPWDLSGLEMRLMFHQNVNQPHFLFLFYESKTDRQSPSQLASGLTPDEPFTMDSAHDLIKKATKSRCFVQDDEFHEPPSALKLYTKPSHPSRQDYIARLSSALDALKKPHGTDIYVYIVDQKDLNTVLTSFTEALAIACVYKMRNVK